MRITWEWYTWVFFALNKRIVHAKDAFLLSNLLEDIRLWVNSLDWCNLSSGTQEHLKEKELLISSQMISVFTRRSSIQ